MGPTVIFDKSALQNLNQDEAMWLDNFYLVNITPLFFIETLADLEKEVRVGRTPEQVVGDIATKTPDMGCVSTHHRNLLQGELMGQGLVEMSGRPILSGGQAVVLGGETGIIFREPPEVEAFKRWQKREFLQVERLIAKKWREELTSINHEENYQRFQQFFNAFGKPKSLSDVKSQVSRIINSPNQKEILILGLALIGVLPEAQEPIIKRWEDSARKPISEFAPYFSYILSVDLFFYLGIAADLISRVRQSHQVDFAYLYYLPFCKVFISSDNLHVRVAPFFIRSDQTFINGSEFKADLAKLDQHYSAFPEEVKSRGVVSFAFCPPDDTSFLTTRLWDKYMASTWRATKTRKFDGSDKIDPEVEKAILEKIRKFGKEAVPVDRDAVGSSDDVHNMIVKHMVSVRKGKWRRFPPEVENSRKRIFD